MGSPSMESRSGEFVIDRRHNLSHMRTIHITSTPRPSRNNIEPGSEHREKRETQHEETGAPEKYKTAQNNLVHTSSGLAKDSSQTPSLTGIGVIIRSSHPH
jgi:hypothetical protein